MQIEPNTKIVQTHFGSQTSLKPHQIMRAFPRQAKGIQQFVIDPFDDLAQTRQPAPQRFGPVFFRQSENPTGRQIDSQMSLVYPIEGRSVKENLGNE